MKFRLLRGYPEDHGRNLTGTLRECWSEITDAQTEGWQAYVIPNEGGHTDQEITRIRALFIDMDGKPLPDHWHVEPDFLVIRDATHWHAYWLVLDIAPADFKPGQQRLAVYYDSDPTICNPSRVMRLAGSVHCKQPPHGDGVPRLVTIAGDAAARDAGITALRAADILAGLPEVRLRKPKTAQQEEAPELWDQPATIGIARRKLRATAEAKGLTFDPGNRNSSTARLTGVCAPYALSEDKIVELITEYIGEIDGEEPEEGVDFVVASTLKTAENNGDRGHELGVGIKLVENMKAAGHDFSTAANPSSEPDGPSDLGERHRKKWIFRTPEEDANQPPLTYFDDHRIKSVLPRLPGGCTVIAVGPRTSHKSGTVLKECLDAVFNKGARVVYFAPEGAHGIKHSRLACALKRRGKTWADVDPYWRTFDAAPGIMSEGEIDDFVEAANAEGFKPDIIVLDTMTRAAGAVDISSPMVGIGLILGMERLAAAFDATVIAVTHPGKDPARGSIGSSLVESLTFAIWKISFDGSAVRVCVDKMKDGPADFTVPLKVEFADNGVPVVVEMPLGERL